MKNTNMWTWPDSEIQIQLEAYGIELKKYNRRDAINAIKNFEEKVAVEGMKETKDYIEQLKEEQPKLELRKVIFHSTGEQDVPYVFVGHNGKAYYIPKEQEIDVPKYILDSCIKDAVEDRIMPKVHPNGDIEWVVRKVQRYPYSFVE
jgi:hypothetical protein